MLTVYCERSGDAFWAEPINALTNLAFLLAAWLCWRLLRRSPSFDLGQSWDLVLLVALVALIGIGSFLWHTFATPWAELADVLPIQGFVGLFLVSFLVRVAGLGLAVALIVFAVFQSLSFSFPAIVSPDLFNGSVMYAPAWLGLLTLTVYARVAQRQLFPSLLGALALFTLSLALRSVDLAVCYRYAVGTHFLWHVLNGGLLYLLTSTLILHAAQPKAVVTRSP